MKSTDVHKRVYKKNDEESLNFSVDRKSIIRMYVDKADVRRMDKMNTICTMIK
jgi:hypothetical protein